MLMEDFIENPAQKLVKQLEMPHILTLDGLVIENIDQLKQVIRDEYIKNFITKNIKIQLSLQLNLSEYLVLRHVGYPIIFEKKH